MKDYIFNFASPLLAACVTFCLVLIEQGDCGLVGCAYIVTLHV